MKDIKTEGWRKRQKEGGRTQEVDRWKGEGGREGGRRTSTTKIPAQSSFSSQTGGTLSLFHPKEPKPDSHPLSLKLRSYLESHEVRYSEATEEQGEIRV